MIEDGNGHSNGNGNGNGRDSKEAKTLEERVRLLRFLHPNDSLLFANGKGPEYFHVSKIEGDKIKGRYLDSSGVVRTKSLSIKYVAQKNPRVASYQPISEQQ